MLSSPDRGPRPLGLLLALAWAGAVWYFSSQSDPPGSGILDVPAADKLAHFGLFFVQAALLRFAGLSGTAAAFAALVLGAVDELHQAFVPGRSPDLLDLVADGLGAVLGAWAVGWAARRADRSR